MSRVSFVVHRFVCGVLDGPKGVGRGDDVAPSSYSPCHFELVILETTSSSSSWRAVFLVVSGFLLKKERNKQRKPDR